MSERKTINLHPYHCDSEKSAGGFVLVFFAKTDGGKLVAVRLHFEFWWIRFIARELWKAIERRYEEITEAKNAMQEVQKP